MAIRMDLTRFQALTGDLGLTGSPFALDLMARHGSADCGIFRGFSAGTGLAGRRTYSFQIDKLKRHSGNDISN